MENEDNLKKLSKEELIRIIDSYKEKLDHIEEYTRVMSLNNMA